MSAPARLAAYGAGLVLVLAASFGLGRAVGPLDQPERVPDPHVEMPAGPHGGPR